MELTVKKPFEFSLSQRATDLRNAARTIQADRLRANPETLGAVSTFGDRRTWFQIDGGDETLNLVMPADNGISSGSC